MVRSTRVLHNNEEFLIQDNGTASATRTITLLVRPRLEQAEGGTHPKSIITNQGEWIPAATWSRERLDLKWKDAEDLVPTMEAVLKDYLQMNTKKNGSTRNKRYHFIEKQGAPDFSFSTSHPFGLILNIYSTKGDAQDKVARDSSETSTDKVRQTHNVRQYLIQAADDGFAGAIIDDEDPVYFCLDKAENMVFMRLSLNKKEDVDEYILEEDGSWSQYDGNLDLELYLDQDNCDRNMVKNLGEIPFKGHDTMRHAWSLEKTEKPDTPFILPCEEGPYQHIAGGNAVILFHSKQNALDFILDRGLFQCEAVCTKDLKPLLEFARQNQVTVLLEPFTHRSSAGTLWLNGKDIILDTFSGFWILHDNWTFDRAV